MYISTGKRMSSGARGDVRDRVNVFSLKIDEMRKVFDEINKVRAVCVSFLYVYL